MRLMRAPHTGVATGADGSGLLATRRVTRSEVPSDVLLHASRSAAGAVAGKAATRGLKLRLQQQQQQGMRRRPRRPSASAGSPPILLHMLLVLLPVFSVPHVLLAASSAAAGDDAHAPGGVAAGAGGDREHPAAIRERHLLESGPFWLLGEREQEWRSCCRV
eukprot:365094-Chlamydomonas_euryale.AAC.11